MMIPETESLFKQSPFDSEFEFNKTWHIYKWRRRNIPSVSDILKALNLSGNYAFVTDEDIWRGQQVHKALELHHTGSLNEDVLDVRIRPYVDAWRVFAEETGVIPLGWEKPLLDKFWGFAGCPDTWGIVNGEITVIDYKTGKAHWSEGLKLAAYASLLCSNRSECCIPDSYDALKIKRIAIELTATGRYNVKPFGDDDMAAWRHALILYVHKKNKERGSHV